MKDVTKIFETIKQLIDEQKWAEAHVACLEVLRYDPENLQAIRYKSQIEKAVKKINIRAVKSDLKSLKPLWKEKKYEDLLFNLKKLDPYIVDYPKLKNIMVKAENAYREKLANEQNDYYKSEYYNVNDLIKAELYEQAYDRAQKLLQLFVRNNDTQKLLTKIKQNWINNELKQHAALLNSKKFDDISFFLQSLLRKIDNKSQHLLELIEKYKNRAHEEKLLEQKDFIFEGLEKVKTLLQLKKFDKAETAAKEVLAIDPANPEAKVLLKRAQKKLDTELEKTLIDQIKKSNKQTSEEYKKDKSKFTRI